MSSRDGSVGQVGRKREQNRKIHERAYELLQDLQNPNNVKELKGILKCLGLLKEMNQTIQGLIDEMGELQTTGEASHDEYRTLKIKYDDFKTHLTSPQDPRATNYPEPPNRWSRTSSTHTGGKQSSRN